jgi:hypothetical protein
MRTPERALEELQSPYAHETFSVLAGEPALVVRFDGEAVSAGPELERALVTLAELPCPSIALVQRPPSGEARRLLQGFDLALDSEADLAAVLAAVHATPLAALSLVQLLRAGETLGTHQGLVAESLVYSTLQSGPEFAAWRASRPEPRERSEHAQPAVLVERTRSRLHLTLNRPEKRNALSAEMRDALAEGLRVALADPSLAEIVLDGKGPSFCSGGDLDEFGTLPDPATAHAVRSTRNPARLLAAVAERTTVHVHGVCMGAGVELPAFAHRVVAREDAFFQLPELAMGLVPGAGGTVSLPRRIGRQRTAYLALSGTRLDARRALEWRLVDEIA